MTNEESDKYTWWKEGAKWLFENRALVKEWVSQIFAWFKSGGGENQPGILIIGPGGTGKTTLAKLLAGENPMIDSLGKYEESLNVEEYNLEDDTKVGIVVPPGQKHRRSESWPEVCSDVAAGKYRGIIVCGSYGFHSLGISYKSHHLFQKLSEEEKREDEKGTFLQENRKEELNVLKQLFPHVAVTRNKIWLLSVITKEDLWWPESKKVQAYYLRGQFTKKLEKLVKANPNFRYETSFVSLIISNFISEPDNEILSPNSAGYDFVRYISSIATLFNNVKLLKEWESIK